MAARHKLASPRLTDKTAASSHETTTVQQYGRHAWLCPNRLPHHAGEQTCSVEAKEGRRHRKRREIKRSATNRSQRQKSGEREREEMRHEARAKATHRERE